MSDMMKSVLLIAAVSLGTTIAVNYASKKLPVVAKLINPGA